jgi:hypothetical protein
LSKLQKFYLSNINEHSEYKKTNKLINIKQNYSIIKKNLITIRDKYKNS